MSKLKLFEMFAGYGGASFALKKAGIDFECVGVSEVDKYAMQCYTQNHKGYHYGDCTKINPNELPDFDILTGGFPCQAFSVAGKGLGDLDTRGTLFNEIIRIAEVKQPRFMLLENVKGLTNKRHKPTFDKILSELKRIGYLVYWKILNSKEHGIPQNRERVFFVCFKNCIENSRLIFDFPQKEELKIFLKDILEEDVDEKYNLKEYTVKRLLNNGQGFRSKINPKVGSCLFASMHKVARGMDIIQLNKPNHSNDRVYSEDGISPTLNTMQGGDRQPFIAVSRGRNIENPSDRTPGNLTEQRLEPKTDGTSNTISTVQKDNYVVDPPKIRKLTPKECFRLMGFLNDEINLDGLSNTQRYKLAGNGWDINLVSKIFKQMFAFCEGSKND